MEIEIKHLTKRQAHDFKKHLEMEHPKLTLGKISIENVEHKTKKGYNAVRKFNKLVMG